MTLQRLIAVVRTSRYFSTTDSTAIVDSTTAMRSPVVAMDLSQDLTIPSLAYFASRPSPQKGTVASEWDGGEHIVPFLG